MMAMDKDFHWLLPHFTVDSVTNQPGHLEGNRPEMLVISWCLSSAKWKTHQNADYCCQPTQVSTLLSPKPFAFQMSYCHFSNSTLMAKSSWPSSTSREIMISEFHMDGNCYLVLLSKKEIKVLRIIQLQLKFCLRIVKHLDKSVLFWICNHHLNAFRYLS